MSNPSYRSEASNLKKRWISARVYFSDYITNYKSPMSFKDYMEPFSADLNEHLADLDCPLDLQYLDCTHNTLRSKKNQPFVELERKEKEDSLATDDLQTFEKALKQFEKQVTAAKEKKKKNGARRE